MIIDTIKRPLFKTSGLQKLFDQHGYVVIDFLAAPEIAQLTKLYEQLPGDLGKPAFASSIMSRDVKYRMEVSSAIEEVFSRLLHALFNEVKIFWGNFNIKYPNLNMGTVPLHQDPSFLDERWHEAMGIWVPLIDTTPANGALKVIPGSHKLLRGPRCGAVPFPYATVQQDLLEQFGKDLYMCAGQAYIGSPALFHASPVNTSSEKRIVAAGLAGPAESSLRYFHYAQANGTAYAEMFEVDRDYYVSQPLFSRPSTDSYSILEHLPLEPLPTADALIESLKKLQQ